jgi:hypothetical protein
MTPAEHYAEAERILSDLTDEPHTLSDADEAYLLRVAQVHATLATVRTTGQPERDRRPHSRACGMFCRGHGRDCAPDCPTCYGSADESTWRPA